MSALLALVQLFCGGRGGVRGFLAVLSARQFFIDFLLGSFTLKNKPYPALQAHLDISKSNQYYPLDNI